MQAAKAECSNHLSYKHRRDAITTSGKATCVKKKIKKKKQAEVVVPGGLEWVIFEEDSDLLLELRAVHRAVQRRHLCGKPR